MRQFIEFLQSMCKPVGLDEPDGRALTKAEREENAGLITELMEELNNPELADEGLATTVPGRGTFVVRGG